MKLFFKSGLLMANLAKGRRREPLIIWWVDVEVDLSEEAGSYKKTKSAEMWCEGKTKQEGESERTQQLSCLPTQPLTPGVKSKVGKGCMRFCWVFGAPQVPSAWKMQTAQAASLHSLPALATLCCPGLWAGEQVWDSVPVQSVPFRDLGLAWRLPKRAPGQWTAVTGARAGDPGKNLQMSGGCLSRLPRDSDLSTVMWSSWSGLRGRVINLWEQPWLAVRLGWAWLFATHGFALQLHPGFLSGGDTVMPGRTGSSGQLLCRVRRGL